MTEEEMNVLIDQKVAEQLATTVETKVSAAIAEAIETTTHRLTASFEDKAVKERMLLLDPTKTEGAVQNIDHGEGYVFGAVPLELIDFNPRSKRTGDELDPENSDLQPLKDDITSRGGIVRPLLVFRKEGRYVLIKGARRLVALRALGEETAQAYIMPHKPPMGLEEEWVNGF